MAEPFDYPQAPSHFRHGPLGYMQAASFRPWLRDEFAFRCVFCLIREQWGRVTGEFDVEHFLPVMTHPELGLVYENLLNACHTCNLLKGDDGIPDPRLTLLANQVAIHPDGNIEGLSNDARRLIEILCLNSDSFRRWRLIWIRNIELALEHDAQQYARLMGFPDDLPDLGLLRPPAGNSRAEGVYASYRARRERGELPETY